MSSEVAELSYEHRRLDRSLLLIDACCKLLIACLTALAPSVVVGARLPCDASQEVLFASSTLASQRHSVWVLFQRVNMTNEKCGDCLRLESSPRGSLALSDGGPLSHCDSDDAVTPADRAEQKSAPR